MSMEEDLVRLVKATVKAEVENQMRTRSSELIGRGGDVTIGGMGDIHIRTTSAHKAYYNGAEILTGSGTGVVTAGLTTNYLPKATASAQIGNSTVKDTGSLVTVENDLDLYKSGGSNYILSFKHPSDSTKKCQMYLFTGVTSWDFIIDATGQLKLSGGSGILFDDPVQAFTQAGNIAMSGFKLTGLGAGTTAGDSVRYEQVIGQYLPISGGTLTGNLTVASGKVIYLDGTNNHLLGGGGSGGALDIVSSLNLQLVTSADAGQTIYFKTGNAQAERMSINNSLITASVKQYHKNNIYFDDNYGLDFRNDGVHMLFYNSAGNDLRYTTYQYHKFDTSITSAATRFEINNTNVISYRDLVSGGGGNYNLGDASNYWNDVSYKTLTDRGCLGSFDDGVELQDGRKVSDVEALLNIKAHPTRMTIYGVPRFDYKTMPKAVYKVATSEGKALPRDEQDRPYQEVEVNGRLERRYAEDGAETTALISIMLGAIKELHERVSKIEITTR